MGLYYPPSVGLGVLHAVKDDTQGVLNSTTLVDITDLTVEVLANVTYDVSAIIIAQSLVGSTQLKIGWTLPASATMFWKFDGISTGAATLTSSVYRRANTESGTAEALSLSTEDAYYEASGRLVVAGTAGTVKLRMAQNTIQASNTTQVMIGSSLTLYQLTPA